MTKDSLLQSRVKCRMTGLGSMLTTMKRSRSTTGPKMSHKNTKESHPIQVRQGRVQCHCQGILSPAALDGTSLWSSDIHVTESSLAAQRCGTKPRSYQWHKEQFPYHIPPRDSRRRKILVTIAATPNREEHVLNNIVHVTTEDAEQACKTGEWRLCYGLKVHSSQGLTIDSSKKVWSMSSGPTALIRLFQWSNSCSSYSGFPVHQ